MKKKTITYKDAGVDIKAGEELVNSIKGMVKETHSDAVLSNIGGFGGFFRPDLSGFKKPVFALTGSNGKTSTKELISRVLGKKYDILATEGNLNNHIGVPLTLLKIHPQVEIAIIEMGASKVGDIAELCDYANPTHGLITNIGHAHTSTFGGIESQNRFNLVFQRFWLGKGAS